MTGYLLDNRARQAGGRSGALSALYDDTTARHLDRLGIGPGARCWEVGAGGPSVPRLLADRVGPTGRVLATDLDTRWLDPPVPGAETLRADVAADDPPGTRFHLVHARLVLVHVPARLEALRRMVSALAPGGSLLVEDDDAGLLPLACPDPRRDEEHRANRVRTAFPALLAGNGVDLAWDRELPRLLREAGLVGVSAEAVFPLAGADAAALEVANVGQVRDALVAQGRVPEEEVDAHLADVGAGRVDVAFPPLVSAWGRREDRAAAS